MNTLVLQVMDLAQTAQADALSRINTGVDLDSRDGIEGALWNILTLSLVAAIAAVVLFVMGPKIIDLGTKATAKIQAPPW